MKPIQATVEVEKTIVLHLSVERAEQIRTFTSHGMKVTAYGEEESPAITEPRVELHKALNMALGHCE